MNVTPVNFTNFQARIPRNLEQPITRLRQIGNVDGYVESMIERHNPQIQAIAETYNTTVNYWQPNQGNMFFVSSGSGFVSSLDLKKMQRSSEFMDVIVDNIRKNTK